MRDFRGKVGPMSSIVIRDHEGRGLFVLDFYDVSMQQLCSIPLFSRDEEYFEYKKDSSGYIGGDIVAHALRKRGIDPHSVMFSVFDCFERGGYV